MKKENLRMQMLAGVITESQYNQMLEEVSNVETIQNEWMRLTTDLIDLVNQWKSGDKSVEEQIHNTYKEVKAAQKNLADSLIDGKRDIELLFTQMFYK